MSSRSRPVTARPKRPAGGLGEDATALASAVDGALHDGERFLRRSMGDRPLATIAAAAGAGFLLGGGLTPSIAARLVSSGSRILLAAALERWLSATLGDGSDAGG
jgi:hypothetical protein